MVKIQPPFQSLMALLLLTAATFANAEQSPTEVIRSATDGVIQELNALSIEQRSEKKVRSMIERYILPALDQERIAKLTLAKHWRRASPEQRQQFVASFRDLYIRTYANAFQQFDGEQIEFNDELFNDKGNKAIVKTTVQQTSGQAIAVDFRLHKNKAGDWLVYDALVEGLGVVKTFRTQYGERLQSISLDELIAEMALEAEQATLNNANNQQQHAKTE